MTKIDRAVSHWGLSKSLTRIVEWMPSRLPTSDGKSSAPSTCLSTGLQSVAQAALGPAPKTRSANASAGAARIGAMRGEVDQPLHIQHRHARVQLKNSPQVK